MAYKGSTPSDLFYRYQEEGGAYRLEIDLHVAGEINDRINEATENAKKGDGKGAVARAKQRQHKRKQLSNKQFMESLRDSGVPIVGKESVEGENR
tara:strand:- start:3375 stop:3659 length:285 start_codon:yes stop_codon:yes gene_type:complete